LVHNFRAVEVEQLHCCWLGCIADKVIGTGQLDAASNTVQNVSVAKP
jgi:hypothetical protein